VLRHDVAELAAPLPSFRRGRVALLGDAAPPVTADQLALFGDPPSLAERRATVRTCPDCGTRRTGPEIPGTFSYCPECDFKLTARFMRWYASHGARSTRKRPGMRFPGGGTIPTSEDTAAMHALLDDTGWPR
jgi:hypothetical protein